MSLCVCRSDEQSASVCSIIISEIEAATRTHQVRIYGRIREGGSRRTLCDHTHRCVSAPISAQPDIVPAHCVALLTPPPYPTPILAPAKPPTEMPQTVINSLRPDALALSPPPEPPEVEDLHQIEPVFLPKTQPEPPLVSTRSQLPCGCSRLIRGPRQTARPDWRATRGPRHPPALLGR